jgi:toxin ParE1/3/4
MKLRWSPEAIEDLVALRAYIAADDPRAAQRVMSRIIDAAELMLPDNPRIGRPGRVSGTRELVIPRTPYILPYRIRDGVIEILRVYHSARKWPDRF